MLQEDWPFYFASKALTEAQKGYVAIEFESLAVAWTMEKFSPFLVYMPFHIRNRSEAFESNVVQKFKSSHPLIAEDFNHNFSISLHYIPCLTNQLADCLSQLGGKKDTIKLPKLHLNQITKQLSARSDSLNQLRLTTQENDEFALLKHRITEGLPSKSFQNMVGQKV